MIRIRYSLLGEKTRFHAFVLNEGTTFCGLELTHKGWAYHASYPHDYMPMCAVCAEREVAVRALVALAGEEEV